MAATQKLLRFGSFELNLATEELRKNGLPLKLSPQPFRILALLAGQAGQIVTREEIRQQVWGGETYVDFEHGMNQCIKQIRTALGDNTDNPIYIETLPRRGYRFLAPVTSKTVEAQPKVVESQSGISRMLPAILGRARVAREGATEETVPPAAYVGTNDIAVPAATAAAAPALTPTPAAVVSAAPAAAPIPQGLPKAGYRNWLRIAFVTVVLVALVGGIIYWHSQRANALTEKDSVVLSDFTNTTGDSVFDDTLKQGLSVQLEQSPFLDVVAEPRVNHTLQLMGRQPGDRLTPEITREVCQRLGSKAMIAGSIALLGSQYVIGLTAVNCETGDVLAEAQEQAPGKEAVLKALDAAVVTLRRKLGESLNSLQKYATPVEEATTPSLEALKAYTLGRKTQFLKGNTAALPFYQRAVELDPNFAMPYAGMALTYYDLSEPQRAAENVRKAYDLRQKVTERERFYIETNYFLVGTGELEKAAQIYEQWQQVYPRDYVPHMNLAFIYGTMGNLDKALVEVQEAVRLEPNNGPVYLNLGLTYASLNRFEEAKAVYQEAEQRKLQGEALLQGRYWLAFLEGDNVQMAQMVAASIGKPGMEGALLASNADTQGWYGKLRDAHELTRRAMDSAKSNDAKETAATYQALAALREVESGNREQAQADAEAALKLAPNRDVRVMAALALARAGDTAGAEKLATELDQEFPLDTMVQRYWLPTVGAAIALQKNDPNRALELLQTSTPIELGQPAASAAVFLCPVYVRGEAYLMLHDGSAAAAEFQKFIDHRGMVVNFPWGAMARLGLARAYVQQGDTPKARATYQDFLTLWKNADPDVPLLKQAKAEYAKLPPESEQ